MKKLFFISFLLIFSTVFAEDTVFVQLKDDARKFLKSDFADCGITYFYKIKRTNFYAVHCDSKGSSDCFLKSPLVKKAVPDKKINIEYKSSDPFFANQWHLLNTGQRGIEGNDAKVAAAWDYLESLGIKPGFGVKIGIIDDAFDLHHPDMKGKYLKGLDLVDGDDYPYADENEPHGTCVTGVIAAVKDNELGVAGACPECKIVPVRSGDMLGEGENMANAFNFVLDHGVQIISNSWGPADNGGGEDMPEVIKEIVKYAREKERNGLGVVIFFAAGNGNEDISAEATFDGYAANENVIAVGAMNAYGQRSNYSDFGKDLDIMAPSSDIDGDYVWNPFAFDMIKDGIWTIDARSWYGYSQSDYTGTFGGTSSAAPLAAAVAGLLISAYPELSRDELYEIITKTADKVSPVDAAYDENGFSEKYGYGRINALAALQLLCERHECNGGLPEIEEETYEPEDLEMGSDIDEFPDDSMLPIKTTEKGCALTVL